jgi:hypothetical protein
MTKLCRLLFQRPWKRLGDLPPMTQALLLHLATTMKVIMRL